MGRFGAPSWGHFWHFWRPRGAKFSPKRVLNAYQHQKREFSPNTSPRVRERKFQSQDGPQNRPRSAQDGSKRLLKTTFFALEIRLNFGLVLGPILVDFGVLFGGLQTSGCDPKLVWKLTFVGLSLWCRFGSLPRRPKRHSRGPKIPPRAPKEAPRGPQEPPRRLQEGLKRPRKAQKHPKRAGQEASTNPKMPC